MGLSLVQRIGPVDPAKTDFRHRLLVGEVSGRLLNLKTSVTSAGLPLPRDLPPVAVDASMSTYAFGGGVRVVGRRRRRVAPFVQAIVSYARINGSVSALFFRESFAYSDLLIEPSGGVDLHPSTPSSSKRATSGLPPSRLLKSFTIIPTSGLLHMASCSMSTIVVTSMCA